MLFPYNEKMSYNKLGGDNVKEKIMLSTLEEIKAFTDPFRYKILMCFYRKKQPATVKEIAVALDEVPANVHYHVKKLEKVGILKLVYTKEINGIIAKYYEPTAENFEINCANEIAESSKQLRFAVSKQFLAQIYDESKNIFIEHIDESKNIFIEHIDEQSETRNKKKGTISMDDLYLTRDEAKEFEKYIADFMIKHDSKARNTEKLKKFHCFFSIVEMK
jgi:DNA-binding transcriptional ArsR family regulator